MVRAVGMWMVVLLTAVALLPPGAAKHCAATGRDTWGHGGGSFERDPTDAARWLEFDNDRNVKATFRQTMDTGSQVVIQDAGRRVSIVLQDGVAGINTDLGSHYEQLYKGQWPQGYDCT